MINLDLRRAKTTSTKISLHEHIAPSLQPSASQRVCLVCSKKEAAYCCPRCFKPYCSVRCYKDHDILCTEEFDKEKVEAVLLCEKEYEERKDAHIKAINTTKPCASLTSGGSDSSDSDDDSNCEDKVEVVDSVDIDALMAKISLENFTPGSLTQDESRLLKQVSNSTVARNFIKSSLQHKMYWEAGARNIEDRCHLNVEMHRVLDFVSINEMVEKVHCVGKDVLTQTDSIEDDPMLFQLLGLLLGYVVMMRTLNGRWVSADNEHLSRYDETANKDGSDDKQENESTVPSSCTQALDLFLQSSPFLTASFRPRSVDACIQAWIHCQPPSLLKLQSKSNHHSHNMIQAVLHDVKQILTSIELTMFVLFDCWILGYLCGASSSFKKTAGAVMSCLQMACYPPKSSTSISYASVLTENIEAYLPTFKSNPKFPKKRMDLRTYDKFTRKCFFLIKHFTKTIKTEEAVESRIFPPNEVGGCWMTHLLNCIQTYEVEILQVVK